ncbi:MAG: AEC family transporter [Myxococcota bacterium]
MGSLLETVGPVFLIVLLGWWLAGRSRLDLATLSNLALMVTSPALMFSVLSGAEVDFESWGVLVGGTLWIALGTAALAGLYFWFDGSGRRGLLLPAIFWNAGNLPLPLARLAYGDAGLEAAAVIFVTVAILNSTVGVWIAKGENGLSEIVRMPLAYGSIGGLALAISGQTLPRIIMEPIEMLGAMAIPLLLINLGIHLRTLALRDIRHTVVVVAIRVMGGAACAVLFIALFGVSGVERKVLLLASIMPAAVINVIIAQRYSRDPSLVASAVGLGTLISLVTIPLVLYFAG